VGLLRRGPGRNTSKISPVTHPSGGPATPNYTTSGDGSIGSWRVWSEPVDVKIQTLGGFPWGRVFRDEPKALHSPVRDAGRQAFEIPTSP
jgi:hypothetical protein